MFIEQIIEFQLRGSGLPGRTCTPISGQLRDKTKTSTENHRGNYFFEFLAQFIRLLWDIESGTCKEFEDCRNENAAYDMRKNLNNEKVCKMTGVERFFNF